MCTFEKAGALYQHERKQQTQTKTLTFEFSHFVPERTNSGNIFKNYKLPISYKYVPPFHENSQNIFRSLLRNPSFSRVLEITREILIISWQAHPDEFQLLVAVVNYKTKLIKPRRGLYSTWLASLDPSNKDCRVPVWVKKGTISFPKAWDSPIVMVGPGNLSDCTIIFLYRTCIFTWLVKSLCLKFFRFCIDVCFLVLLFCRTVLSFL